MIKTLRKYESDFGQVYVQVEHDGARVELAFDHNPSDSEIDSILATMTVEIQVELVAENGEII